ncbi:basement membrane-specific heparan sulfate proteoglycan core protein-like [Antedon mediterranea]|uniref:basement membrane-specific heparan sulfate proteoglycan core protein-like n=1 Tax=Antedon mediterranea TaxID=105859 RepID=UPI003AF5F9A1
MAILTLFIFTLFYTSLSSLAQTVADDQDVFLPVSTEPKHVEDKSLYFEEDKKVNDSTTSPKLEDVLFQDEPGSGEVTYIPTTPRFVVHATDETHFSQPQTPTNTDDEDLVVSGSGDGTPSGESPVRYYRITIFALNIVYTSELENHTSAAYTAVASPLQIAIDELYLSTPGEQFATILQFSELNGGVEVLFDLGSIDYYYDDRIQYLAQSAVETGQIGTFNVDPKAFHFEVVQGKIFKYHFHTY